MSTFTLPFEAPVVEIDRQIAAIQEREDAAEYADELASLGETRDSLLTKLYGSLSPWNTVRVARHPDRPQTSDYLKMICRDFRELHGDRHFGDDPAIVTGFARIGSHKVMLVAHRKGKTTEERIDCHFGCAHPEGYRKALQKMKLAEKHGLPIVTLIDTPGAYPGIKAEERGQAAAIAMNLKEMSRLRTPIVSIVIGEGGSGGALGIGVADRIAMMQFAWYSVISPEGCAAILWKIANEQTNEAAANNLALTSAENLKNGLIDAILPEPLGGAHRAPEQAAEQLERWIVDTLNELSRFNPETLVNRRYEKFAAMGVHGVEA
ncbi:MAG: acetyl-CoA carboxylase carboxyltransferase subunit alpha [Phycisphaerales bacterium]|jgi:acetyl-CoA carboxylase carboxyl transferase subunit alpha|nr:acetyl-CoA carboxylase carboxyltransferase subunit alpha [Phycisphaerales bacterium]